VSPGEGKESGRLERENKLTKPWKEGCGEKKIINSLVMLCENSRGGRVDRKGEGERKRVVSAN